MKSTKKVWLALLAGLTIGLATYNELRAEDIIVICSTGDTCCSLGGRRIAGRLQEIIVVG